MLTPVLLETRRDDDACSATSVVGVRVGLVRQCDLFFRAFSGGLPARPIGRIMSPRVCHRAVPEDGRREEGVIRVEREHRFAIPVEAGFAFITDPANWPAYWPGFVRIEPGSQWSAPGDEARIVIR